MWLSDISVKRPVFASVISLLLVALGSLAFLNLQVQEYPDIQPAIISVAAMYPGASAEVVESRVTQLLESEVSGIEGIKQIESRSSDNISSITIEFELGRDIDSAANDVRDRVSRVSRRLPEGVEIPLVAKQQSDARALMYVSVSNPDMTVLELVDYMERFIIDRFATIPGVSQVNTIGSGRPSMRIWLDRFALAARELAVADIDAALRRENVELPAGRLESSQREYQIRLARNFQTEDDFRQLVIAQGEDGHLIRLGEVARVEIGSDDLRTVFRTNGIKAVSMAIIKQSKANTVDVSTAVVQEIERLNAELPPGFTVTKSSDESLFIRAAINSVYLTIGVTTVLVGLVILGFLGSLRAMAIPVVTIPICLTAAFIVLGAFGYSVNLITLLALVLSIGLVVDDAIVVLENVHRRIEKGEAPLLAAFKGTRQVSFAVIATTAVLVAVFAPIVFLQDNVGKIFSELAITVSAAVIFSSVLALSLVPMLCSKLLRPPGKETRFAQALDSAFDSLGARYQGLLQRCLKAPLVVFALAAIVVLAVIGMLRVVPQEYAPMEDQGISFTLMRAAEGTSLERMRELIAEVEVPVMPYVESGDVQRVLVRAPNWQTTQINSGAVIISMAPWGESEYSTQEMIDELMKSWATIPDLRMFSFMRSGIARHGGGRPVKLVLGGTDYEQLARWRDVILGYVRENPGLLRVDSDLQETQPQLLVRVDRNRAAALGVSADAIGRTIQTMMSEDTITTYVVDGEEYDVIVQAEGAQRVTVEDLRNVYVRSERSGELIPLSNLVQTENTAGASSRNRFNRLRAVTISASLAPGYALGDALKWLEKLVKSELPEAQIGFKGESLEFKESSGGIYFTFGIALLVVFLVLAAQFESFLHPLIILVTVPLAIAGGLLGLFATGLTFNIYSQIGMIILVGIAAKNGILIVEFINQLRDAGTEFGKAVIDGARIRFRPVVMTTISTVMGSIPLMLASGPGSESRVTLGVVMFSGVAFATLLTLFVVPVCYATFARATGSPKAIERQLKELTN